MFCREIGVMDKINKILKQVIDEIKPKNKNILIKKIKSVVNDINNLLKDKNIDAKCVVGGSFAKDTFLRNDFDVDLFVVFNEKYRNKNISKILYNTIKNRFDIEVIKGSRDYFRFKNEFNFEVIPVLKIKDKIQNITDMSPLHVKWVDKYKKKNKNIVDEIRLVKQFCKAQRCYGAESYIRGFSGHVIDILTIYYGGFINLLKNCIKWKKNDVIDVERYYKNNEEVLLNLNKSKISPLIVIDPILPERNAAAALSYENFLKLKNASKEFIKNPSKDFFVIKKINKDYLKKKYKRFIYIDAEPVDARRDISGTRFVRLYEYIKTQLILNDFNIVDSGCDFESHVMWFVLKKYKLKETKKHKGPKINQKNDIKRFIKKHKNAFIEEGRYFAIIKRKYLNTINLINNILKSNYIKDKIKKINILEMIK